MGKFILGQFYKCSAVTLCTMTVWHCG